MRLSTRIGFGLGLFYLILGFGYALTRGDFIVGFPLLMMSAICIAIFGSYAYLALRRAERAEAIEEPAESEPHIGSTVWPFGYAVCAGCVVVGFIGYSAMYVVAGVLFVASTLGWFGDVRGQWDHRHEPTTGSGCDPGPESGHDSGGDHLDHQGGRT